MKSILKYSLLLSLLIFTGCSNKINFSNYEVQNYIEKKDLKYKKPIKLTVEQINFESLSNIIQKQDLINISNYNNFLHRNFNTVETNLNIKVEIILEELLVYPEYVEGHTYSYKGEKKWSEPYYNLVSYSRIASKITTEGKVKIFRADTQYSRRIETYDFYQPRYSYYGFDKLYSSYYQSVIKGSLTKIFVEIQKQLMTPFTVVKVLKELKNDDKKKPLKVVLELNGGTCDGLYSGQYVNVYSKENNDLIRISKGEVTSDSSCHTGWVKIEKYIREPKSFDIVH
jgi:hypothetical protein